MAGKTGRPATPSKVHWLRGSKGAKPAHQMLDEFTPDTELPECPAHLKNLAKKHYGEIGSELERYGLVAKIDVGMLAMLATCYAKWVWAEKKIQALNTADKKNGEAGLVATTPNGYKVMSVYEQLARDARSQYQKLAAEFGLSPSNRTRVRAGSPQLELPGVPDSESAGAGGPRLADFA